jgi:hypothetical protein
MAKTFLDPRTIQVGDTFISRDCDSSTRFVVEKVESRVVIEPSYSRYRNAAPNRYVEFVISGSNGPRKYAFRLTGTGTPVKFSPDGTCAVYETGGGLSLQVIKAAK